MRSVDDRPSGEGRRRYRFWILVALSCLVFGPLWWGLSPAARVLGYRACLVGGPGSLRRWALGRLEAEGRPGAMALGEVALDRGEAFSLRLSALESLERLGVEGAGAAPLAARALSDDHVAIRFSAARALSGMGAPAAVAIPSLRRALLDSKQLEMFLESEEPGVLFIWDSTLPSDWDLRLAIAEAIGRLDPDGGPFLIKALRHEHGNISGSAGQVLEAQGLSLLPVLIRSYLSKPSPQLMEILFGIGRREPGAEIDAALVRALHDEEVQSHVDLPHVLAILDRSLPAKPE